MEKCNKIKVIGNTAFHESAGGYLFSEGGGKLCVALLKDNSGKYFIPKGHFKYGETPEQVALREIKEEFGLEESPSKVAKLGIVTYSFTKPNDKKEHVKDVHLYVFSLQNRVKIKPLKDEGYLIARWFEIDEAFEKLEYGGDTLREAVRLYDGYKVLLSHLEEIKRKLRGSLGINLLAIIDAGSVSSGDYKPNWSDIDLLLVVKSLDLQTKLKLAKAARELEETLNTKLGLNIISEDEFASPKFPEIRLAGKTLQALVELSLNPGRLIYANGKLKKAYVPNRKEVKSYSLSNIALLVLSNRGMITSVFSNNKDNFKRIVEKQIRYASIIIKLALQYFEGKICETKADILVSAKLYFDDYDFSKIQEVFEKTKQWKMIKEKKTLEEILKDTDDFIENFSEYVFSKVTLPK